MIGKKINQLATELAPTTTDLTIIGDPVTGVSKKITLEQLGAIFGGAVSFYTTLGDFPATGVIDIIYCAKDTKKLYLWSGSAYVEVFPSQSLLDTYQLRSEKGVSNGYASLDVNGKVPIGQLPNSIMEYKGTWNAATNTPTLANGTGDTGDVYICNAAGTVNFGAGPITFAVGDYVVYSGSIWQRSSGAVGTVTSVAVSRSGDALAITGSPITTSGTINIGFAGTGAQYIKGDGTLATFPSIISQAQNLVTEVYNNTGATLTKGTIVYINGGQGNLPTVTKALATGDSTSAQTYGVVQTDITNMNNGYVVVAGRLTDLDTQAYANGTQLYLSSTTAGTWTSTKQYAPNHLVYVGIVVRSHPTQGVVEIKIQNGYEMDELHNVAAQNPDNNDILQYKTATSLWTKVAGTTTNIAEGTNLYYTDARSRAALSFTAGSGAYNSTTGVITIPTNTNQLTNGAAFITLASLSAGAGISYNNTTGVIASTITQYTDALARAAISLTTTGTSGAATYNNTTGVLNIPQYQTALTNPVTGTGTTNYLPKFTGTSTIGNSIVQDNGSAITIAGNVGINGSPGNSFPLEAYINSSTAYTTSSRGNVMRVYNSNTSANIFAGIELGGAGTANDGLAGINAVVTGSGSAALTFYTRNSNTFAEKMRIDASGNLGLGVTPSAWWSGARSMQIGLGGSIAARTSSDFAAVELSANQIINTSAQRVYIGTGYASLYEQFDGAHKWLTAPSGTAGNAISFTQAMTLDASGRLGIGTTNPASYGTFRQLVLFGGSTGGGLTIASGSSASGVLAFANGTSGTEQYKGFIEYQHSGDNMVFGVNAATRLTIASTGAATFSSSVTATGLTISSNGSNGGRLGVDDSGLAISSKGSTPIAFWTNDFTDQRMRITSGGNVLLGTTTDTGALLNLNYTTSGNVALNINRTSSSAGYFYNFAIAGSQKQYSYYNGSIVEFGVAGTIQTASPSSGSAHAWKLGSYAAGGTGTATGVIYIEVNGQIYSIPALLGTP